MDKQRRFGGIGDYAAVEEGGEISEQKGQVIMWNSRFIGTVIQIGAVYDTICLSCLNLMNTVLVVPSLSP